MDVEDLNRRTFGCRNSLNNTANNKNSRKFCIGTYFVWFSALIFFAELITDLSLAIYYVHEDHLQWGLITFCIIVLPSMLIQFYSIFTLRKERNIELSVLTVHILLLGIPYRYRNVLKNIDKDKLTSQDKEAINKNIEEINRLQLINSVCQYLPQFLFQAYLIIYRKHKCVITGVSAGLAAFSFFWHFFICICNSIRKRKEKHIKDLPDHIIKNLPLESTSSGQIPGRDHFLSSLEPSYLRKTIKVYEKSTNKTHDRNLVSKKQSLKNIEKKTMFGFNKRKAMYEKEEFDLYDYNNMSTVFFEVNETSIEKNDSILMYTKISEEFHNENNSNILLAENTNVNIINDSDLKNKLINNVEINTEPQISKRKGICSSQQMLNLVDVMNDITPEQVDVLAKSLIEMGGDDSLKADSGANDTSSLLDRFPECIDEKLMESIEAAIYENQVIFQERIRKNQLTIQNLKLQDQLLSKYIEEIKNLPSTEIVNIRDYENMVFANVNRLGRLKHWRNYIQGIDTDIHDNSTIQNSSFYVNTMSNSLTDLYVNETDICSVATEDEKLSTTTSNENNKNNTHWLKKHQKGLSNSNADESLSDNLYINMTGAVSFLPRKNILVETINAINVDSPVGHIVKKTKASKIAIDENIKK